jgi:hypothetical protein
MRRQRADGRQLEAVLGGILMRSLVASMPDGLRSFLATGRQPPEVRAAASLSFIFEPPPSSNRA